MSLHEELGRIDSARLRQATRSAFHAILDGPDDAGEMAHDSAVEVESLAKPLLAIPNGIQDVLEELEHTVPGGEFITMGAAMAVHSLVSYMQATQMEAEFRSSPGS